MKKVKRKIKILIGVMRVYQNWWLWPFYRAQIFHDTKERVMNLRNSLRFAVRFDLNEPGTIDDVLIRNEYFTIQNIIPDRAVVIDIGANIGAFSVVAAHSAKNVKVFSYEPTPETFSRLVKNVDLNGFNQQIRAFNLAIAGTAGERKLFLHPEISGANTIAPYREDLAFVNAGSTITVSAITLAEVFYLNNLERCDFLKMDCEGSEFEIIGKTPNRIFSRIDHMAMEYHRDPKEIKDRLAKLGFLVVVAPVDAISGFLYADKIK